MNILHEICPHRIMVLHRLAKPGPPGLPGSIPGVGVYFLKPY